MTWILMTFCQIVEGSRPFRSKKPRQKQSGTSLYPDTLSLHIFCPYNPYFSLQFCLKILRGDFCDITHHMPISASLAPKVGYVTELQ